MLPARPPLNPADRGTGHGPDKDGPEQERQDRSMSRAERFDSIVIEQEGRLAAMLASRMCHDLVSPLGAIGNGLELLEMAGGGGGPEFALMADSVAAARARLRLFQLAFGRAGDDQRLPVAELRDVLTGPDVLGRLVCVLDAEGDLPSPTWGNSSIEPSRCNSTRRRGGRPNVCTRATVSCPR